MTDLAVYLIWLALLIAVTALAGRLYRTDVWERETWADERDRAWGWADDEGGAG